MSKLPLKRNVSSVMAKMWNREFIVFLFLFIMSAAFWVLMTLNETYERDVRIPVALQNVPNNVILLDNENDTITVNVRANGSEFLYRTFSPIGSIKLDFSQYKQNDKVFVSNNELQKHVKQALGKSVQILSVKHDGLTFRFNNGEHKRLPVRFMGRVGSKADKEIILEPDSVDVYSMPDILNSLKEIRTVSDSIDFKEDVSEYFQLEAIRGVKCKPSKVKVNIKSRIFVENTIEVPVECINEPANKKLILFPPRVSIIYVVDIRKHSLISKELFHVVADYNEVADMASDQCTFTLVSKPSFVKQAKLSMEGTKYLIKDR